MFSKSVGHSCHLNLISSFNDFSKCAVVFLKWRDFLTEHFDFLVSLVIVSLQRFLVHDSCLLLQLLVDVPQVLSVLLQLTQFSLFVVKNFVKFFQMFILDSVLLLNILKFFSRVTQNHHSSCNLFPQFVQFFVSLFDFLIQSLVFNFKLFEINQMESISQLFLFLENFLLVGQSVPQSYILQSVLMHLLILESVHFFPLVQNLFGDFFTSSTENGVLGYATLQFFKLLLDFMAFSLLFIQFSLKFRGHLIVSILSFLQVETHLVHISKSVEIFMFIHRNIRLFIILFKRGFH